MRRFILTIVLMHGSLRWPPMPPLAAELDVPTASHSPMSSQCYVNQPNCMSLDR